jgi:glycosyltransferase involved in cell wall biosynthesis
MRIIGMMRVKNEARWIARSIESILPVCNEVLVMDDHSTDGTPEICAALAGVQVLRSPFEGVNEMRDKNWLLEQAGAADWILAIDGDEVLAPGDAAAVRAAMNTSYQCLSMRIVYLWNSENQARIDGVYGDFRRESAFRPSGARFCGTSAGGNFHCGNVPIGLRQKRHPIEATLLHLGYMNREDRLRKYAWYNAQDPRNGAEDGYRHMVIGDLFPADSAFAHGGPLRLEAI